MQWAPNDWLPAVYPPLPLCILCPYLCWSIFVPLNPFASCDCLCVGHLARSQPPWRGLAKRVLLISGVHAPPSDINQLLFYDVLVHETEWYYPQVHLAAACPPLSVRVGALCTSCKCQCGWTAALRGCIPASLHADDACKLVSACMCAWNFKLMPLAVYVCMYVCMYVCTMRSM
jgi:hypothetical protein